ncbi:alpha-taxilin [Copidosoma floridanum]|uniref:alpha-taxilin n=1 Tax=Copidosoma floridanum TaxID=29053 RepID=UPI0006C945BF|nr:alpha-taxilin [Copidosoma floridanum]
MDIIVDEIFLDNNVAEELNNDRMNAEPRKEVEIAPSPIRIKEKRNSKEEKSKKKDERNIDQVLKSLSDLDAEKKLSAVAKKYMEILDENRKLQLLLKMTEKKVVVVQREKDQCESERSKAVLTRSRLESLCRELQRQNKAIKEESMLKIREEEEKRKEVSAKFQSTLTEITALMTETNEKNVKLHEDNMDIHKKFKTVFEEMDAREKQFEEMHTIMKEELKSTEARLAKVNLEMAEEKEKLLREKSQMLITLTEYQKKIVELQKTEANLRSQVAMYTDKYADFQTALSKSHEVFGEFNSQMEKMSKKILKLEKETNMWKTRWEKNNNALLDMATEKQTRDAEMVALNKKCSLLQELCKTFQQERAKLIAQLKEKSQNSNNENSNDNNATNHPITNGSDTLNETNDKVAEQTKEEKTESTCPLILESKGNPEVCCQEIVNSSDEKKNLVYIPPKTKENEQVSVDPENCIQAKSSPSEQLVEQNSVIANESTHNTDAVTANGEVHLDSASNKKHKEGKKKRK